MLKRYFTEGDPAVLTRRRFIAAAMAGTAALGASFMMLGRPFTTQTPTRSTEEDAMQEGLERGLTRVKGFDDAEMDFQLIRQLGSARYGGASVGECLALAQQIRSGDPASWVAAFAAAAARTEADARQRASRDHRVSARDQLLVASNSYRAAEYYTSVADPQHVAHGLKSRECFLEAMKLQDHVFEVVSLPYGNTPLPAYYMRPEKASGRGKTLMIVSGYDGTLEETYLAYGKPALERGYNLLLFAGPGQMDTLRLHPGLTFIPEYERVGALALDHLLARPETDPARIALMGISFGGYFATRMAAHDSRIRALIPNSPIVNLHDYMASFVGFDPAEMPDADDFRPQDVDRIPDEVAPPQVREMSRNLMLRFGQESFKQTYRRLRDFRVDDADLERITCPTLALVGSGEGKEPKAQFDRFLKHVSGPSTSHVFDAVEGADGHCQSGNLAYSAAVSMDWLDERFRG
ncbi:Esterase FrsA [compost metagenome]